MKKSKQILYVYFSTQTQTSSLNTWIFSIYKIYTRVYFSHRNLYATVFMYFGKRIRVGIFCGLFSLFAHINNLCFQNPNKTDMSEACFCDHHLLFSATVRGPLRTRRHSIQTCFIYIHLSIYPSIHPYDHSFPLTPFATGKIWIYRICRVLRFTVNSHEHDGKRMQRSTLYILFVLLFDCYSLEFYSFVSWGMLKYLKITILCWPEVIINTLFLIYWKKIVLQQMTSSSYTHKNNK